MKVDLAYGEGWLPVELPDDRTTLIKPTHTAGLPDEKQAVLAALRQPIGTGGLSEAVQPDQRVCIIFTDLTRATPNHRIIPWLLEELAHVPVENITLLNSTGTHRPNTPAELEKLLTADVLARYRVVNHDCHDTGSLVEVGRTRGGAPALINRHVVEADVRIVTGFIEPHFFAGFSGGPKGIMPGCAGLETVMSNHGAANIGDARATFGVTDGNPLWEELRDIALRVGPSFLLNVTLNEERQITGVFAGDLIQAHQAGIEFERQAAMQAVDAPFEVVVTTNSGYPLDLNLYQGVKGMSAGARILKEGGALILACECREGVPSGSPLDKFYHEAGSPEEILALLATPGFVRPEQWQAHIQALIQRRARVFLHSTLADETVRACFLEPCADIAATVRTELDRFGPNARVAVLPQGPLTIPYLR
ncbi:MAG: nickel-dependent lactate racemase [Verrucomicrobiales bacterium]|nr:nickel-dependent lactate racemase [Verrucomicrobiales bacterium]MCP5526282.1 nickel-dependent lactate racemase [Verrucomicrobiales bacterium]